jgi:hypothetical protein
LQGTLMKTLDEINRLIAATKAELAELKKRVWA